MLYFVRDPDGEGNLVAFENPSLEAIRALLERVTNIAIVGFSLRPGRASHNIARQLQRFGFRVIPVRPGIAEGLGEKAYPNLSAVRDRIDLVNVFRESAAIPGIVEECLAINAPAIWIQEGIVHDEAAEQARAAGLTVVMDRCIYKDYVALCQ